MLFRSYNDLKSLRKEYDNTKNGFVYALINTSVLSNSIESAQDLSDIDMTKFVDMKVLKFYYSGVNNFIEFINSNEKITAINYIKAYKDDNDNHNIHIIISYNTESESNKIINKNINNNVSIQGIFYSYNVDNLKDIL